MLEVSTVAAATNSPNSTRSKGINSDRRRRDQFDLLEAQIQIQRDQQTIKLLRRAHQTLREENCILEERIALLVAADSPIVTNVMTRERPMAGHQFGVHLIALCIELAKRIGFRATQFVIEKVFVALDIDLKVPSHDAIEQWTLRLGVAELKNTFTKNQRVVWMADHSSQIGKEQVLLIIGIALEDLLTPNQTLDLNKLKVLAIIPGKKWKKEDVEREYKHLADQIGAPVYLLCDGASELRDPAETLEKDGQKTIVLGDLKHVTANLFEKLIGRGERFSSFLSHVGLTRNRTQQTEMGHFKPPTLKQKSRFMNLGPLLRWSAMVRYHLDHPESTSRYDVTPERMEEKFGWLREFDIELKHWNECQTVIDTALHLINHEGLGDDSTDRMKTVLSPWLKTSNDDEPATQLSKSIIDFVESSRQKLHNGDRAWLSTEILESLFGRFKQLEGQHSKSGFTRLIAAIPTFCRKVTATLVRNAFSKVKSADLKQWITNSIPTTLASKRNIAYREYRADDSTN